MERWKKALIDEQSTLQDVIRNLDQSALQIAMVVAQDGTLLGTVTDGDIRRALLRGLDLTHRVGEVLSKSPMVAPPGINREAMLNLMRANRIHQLPVVDDNRKVVGLHLWDDMLAPAERPNMMVIMAGGFGRRLLPLTEDCPKPMLPVAGKPMLEHILERARDEGIRRFVLSIHYLGHVIRDHFGDGAHWNVEIDYVQEDTPLGTAGALGLLAPRPAEPFLVTNGDVLTDIRYAELLDFHLHHRAAATMAVRQHEWQHPFGVVHTQGITIVGFEEKPVHRSHVNAGIYVLEPSVLDTLAPGEVCDMPALLERQRLQGGQIIAYPMHEPWLDVGRPEDLMRANTRKQEAKA